MNYYSQNCLLYFQLLQRHVVGGVILENHHQEGNFQFEHMVHFNLVSLVDDQ